MVSTRLVHVTQHFIITHDRALLIVRGREELDHLPPNIFALWLKLDPVVILVVIKTTIQIYVTSSIETIDCMLKIGYRSTVEMFV